MGPSGWRWWAAAARALAGHPSLWTTAVIQVFRLAPSGWWRRPPFLPTPDPDYLRFRLETQYGTDQAPDAGDIVTYLHWCRTIRALG